MVAHRLVTNAWRNTTLSSGAMIPNNAKGNFATRAFNRMTKSDNFIHSKLKRRRQRTASTAPVEGYGKVELTLFYPEEKNRLVVIVHQAQNLKPVNADGVADPYIKVRLLKDGVAVLKHGSQIKHQTLNPVFDETFTFEVRPEEVSQRILVMDIKDAVNYGLFASKPVLGQLMYDLARFDVSKSCHQWFDLARPCYDTLEGSKAV